MNIEFNTKTIFISFKKIIYYALHGQISLMCRLSIINNFTEQTIRFLKFYQNASSIYQNYQIMYKTPILENKESLNTEFDSLFTKA